MIARIQFLEGEARTRITVETLHPNTGPLKARIQLLEAEAKIRTTRTIPNLSPQAIKARIHLLEAEAKTTKEDLRHKTLKIQNLRSTISKNQTSMKPPEPPNSSINVLLGRIITLEAEVQIKATKRHPNVLKAQVNVEPSDNGIREKFAKLNDDIFKLVSTREGFFWCKDVWPTAENRRYFGGN